MEKIVPYLITIPNDDASIFILDWLNAFVKLNKEIEFYFGQAIPDRHSDKHFSFTLNEKDFSLQRARFPILAVYSEKIGDLVLFPKSKVSQELTNFIGQQKRKISKNFYSHYYIESHDWITDF